MRLNFRQGIVTYPSTGTVQSFLSISGSDVNLLAANGRTDIAFAHGSLNYLYTESVSISSAWPNLPSQDVWIYWDLNTRTAVRTFGYTTVAPVVQSTQPTVVSEGLHWFNTYANKMYAYISGGFREVIRVFAAKVNVSTGIFTPLGSGFPLMPYAGTQVGINTDDNVTGRIVVDNTGTPIKTGNGSFFTTETEFFTNGSPVNITRIDTAVIPATALENVSTYQVVKFSSFGNIQSATYEDLQTTVIGLTLDPILIGNVGFVCVQGCITNPLWNWSTVGAELWVTSNGTLTDVDPHVTNALQHPNAKPSIGRVLTPTSIIFNSFAEGTSITTNAIPNLALNDLTDVTIDAPQRNQYLIFDGIEWVNSPLTPISLNDLTDVTITNPQSGQTLVYNGSVWINSQSGSGSSITPLSILNLMSDNLSDAPTLQGTSTPSSKATIKMVCDSVDWSSPSSYPLTTVATETYVLSLYDGTTLHDMTALGSELSTFQDLLTKLQQAFGSVVTFTFGQSDSSIPRYDILIMTAISPNVNLRVVDGAITNATTLGGMFNSTVKTSEFGIASNPINLMSYNSGPQSTARAVVTVNVPGTLHVDITHTGSTSTQAYATSVYNVSTGMYSGIQVYGITSSTVSNTLDVNNGYEPTTFAITFGIFETAASNDVHTNVSLYFEPLTPRAQGLMTYIMNGTETYASIHTTITPYSKYTPATTNKYAPVYADEYYIVGLSPTGKWAAFNTGDLVRCTDGTNWVSYGNALAALNNQTVGIALASQSINEGYTTGPSGSFAGYKGYTAKCSTSAPHWTFSSPTVGKQVCVTDSSVSDVYNQRRLLAYTNSYIHATQKVNVVQFQRILG